MVTTHSDLRQLDDPRYDSHNAGGKIHILCHDVNCQEFNKKNQNWKVKLNTGEGLGKVD